MNEATVTRHADGQLELTTQHPTDPILVAPEVLRGFIDEQNKLRALARDAVDQWLSAGTRRTETMQKLRDATQTNEE